jgi:Mlc titration factor MtfA (ptsG expression regulator)
MFGFKNRRRRKLMQSPLSSAHAAIVERNVPYSRMLTAAQRRRHQGLTQIFLEEKYFEGCGGLTLTDEIRVTIAAGGCILILGLDTEVYPKLRSVLVYPRAYKANVAARQPDGTVAEGWEGRLGESWMQGYVVVSWEDVLRAASDRPPGRNVLFHEFAHQLDNESGAPEGAPALADPRACEAWARVFGAEFQALREALERGEPTFLDPYGATDPAEFFAVATEYFFELPAELKLRHRELYGQLMEFYRQDPEARSGVAI